MIKNNIYFWKDMFWFLKVSMAGCFIQTVILILILYVLNEKSLWIAPVTGIITFGVAISVRLLSLLTKHYGPRYIEINEKGLSVYFLRNKALFIPWSSISGMIEMDYVHIPTGVFKAHKIMEYRIFYSDSKDNMKWFCVSREIGLRIKKELEKIDKYRSVRCIEIMERGEKNEQ